ncbi:hypothetical protein Pyrfu_1047 [Pyrolobus fumarii 1A]|uniref:Uncharacterized protein n=1 Tax=Pyrolobus fumarii (strain DSM 11204 / 1A) TaxID=694429 RepID=G0EF18_PYRF1|nr:hypothetical protein [Pyrolobus fumarii]AEM38915.1 hypothetical protein Pyrfu_1047 [Pyrolobus fumarii 1A]
MAKFGDVRYWVKTGAALAFVAVTLWLSYYFFVVGVGLVSRMSVVAGVLSAAIGFALLSASVTVMRDWVLAIRGREGREEAGASS